MPRPRKPDHLKLVSGTAQPCRMQQAAPLGDVLDSAPPAPDWLPTGHATKEWLRLAPILVANRLLTDMSLSAFGHLCALHGKLAQLWAAGETPRASLVAQYKGLIDAFGIPPLSAGKLRPAGDRKRPNPFDDLDPPPSDGGRV